MNAMQINNGNFLLFSHVWISVGLCIMWDARDGIGDDVEIPKLSLWLLVNDKKQLDGGGGVV